MTPEPLKIEFVSEPAAGKRKEMGSPAPEQSPEKKPLTPSLAELAKKTMERFTTPAQKRRFLQELAQELQTRAQELAPQLRQQLYGNGNKLNLNQVTAVYGLGEHLRDQITPDGDIVDEANDTAPDTDRLNIPDRPANAKGATELFREWGLHENMNPRQEELAERIIAEIRKGNVPDSCRRLHTVTMRGEDGTRIAFRTGSDYLAIGSNEDNIRIPVSGKTARRIADEFGWVLPTASMAQTTDNAADIVLAVGGETHSGHDLQHMADLEYAVRHNQRAQKELRAIAKEKKLRPQDLPDKLIRGHKKNVYIGVESVPEQNQPNDEGKLGIGGLRDPSNKNRDIQPYCYPHGASHFDYSGGMASLESEITVYQPGQPPRRMHLYDALQDPKLARTLNASEGGRTFDARQAYLRRQPRQQAQQNRRQPRTKTT